ncbi:MAG TPA: lytic transglycosylase domain-containing protein [Longimicrobiales bacterium]|nr:lytic transglycosylase domain-containing protein [Longimicrobiales bacterium]
MTAHDRTRDRRETPTGPFPEGARRDRPWEATESAHGPFERRRAGDRRGLPRRAEADDVAPEGGEERRRPWGRRKSDFETGGGFFNRMAVRRLREPIIGVALAGVAVPLVNAGMDTSEEAEGVAAAREASRASEAGRDLESGVGNYWADAEAEAVRANTIEGAMVRYQIGQDLAEEIYDAAERYGIEPDVAFGLVNTESTFRERAVSHVGARGLTQVMPRTAEWLDPTISVSELFDRERNLDLGFKYLRMMIDKYEGNVENALTAYNRGPGTVDRILDRGGNPDNGYAGKVLSG